MLEAKDGKLEDESFLSGRNGSVRKIRARNNSMASHALTDFNVRAVATITPIMPGRGVCQCSGGHTTQHFKLDDAFTAGKTSVLTYFQD